LISSIPLYGKDKIIIKGDSAFYPTIQEGCPFAPRCSKCLGTKCKNKIPEIISIDSTHKVRCHLYYKNDIGLGGKK
jgi:oligopeptide/dipeptide ABC transporter ATP-binding protein